MKMFMFDTSTHSMYEDISSVLHLTIYSHTHTHHHWSHHAGPGIYTKDISLLTFLPNTISYIVLLRYEVRSFEYLSIKYSKLNLNTWHSQSQYKHTLSGHSSQLFSKPHCLIPFLMCRLQCWEHRVSNATFTYSK